MRGFLRYCLKPAYGAFLSVRFYSLLSIKFSPKQDLHREALWEILELVVGRVLGTIDTVPMLWLRARRVMRLAWGTIALGWMTLAWLRQTKLFLKLDMLQCFHTISSHNHAEMWTTPPPNYKCVEMRSQGTLHFFSWVLPFVVQTQNQHLQCKQPRQPQSINSHC